MGYVGKTMPFAPSPKSRSIGGMFTIPKWVVDYCFTHIIYTFLLVGNVISFSVLVAVVSWDDGPQQKKHGMVPNM